MLYHSPERGNVPLAGTEGSGGKMIGNPISREKKKRGEADLTLNHCELARIDLYIMSRPPVTLDP